MCSGGPDLANLLSTLLPSSLHDAAAAVGGSVVQPVLVSGAPLSAPPSIDNCGGSEDRVVDYRRNDVLGRASGASEQQFAAPAAVPQLLHQSDIDEIVILGERPAPTNYGTAPVSAPSPAPSAATAAEAAQPTVHSSQAMQLSGIAGLDLPLLVSATSAGTIVLNDPRLPGSPDSPQTIISTATSSGVSSGASSSTVPSSAALTMVTLKDALISNGDMMPKQEPLSHEGSESGLDLNGRPPVPLCSICSADSTGIHFGVEACAACSAFFRRTVVLSKNYECTKGGDCVTHKDTGGSQRCRACRFKKCLTVGMDRNAVQHRRDAIGKVSQIKKESSPGMDDDMSTMMNGGQNYHHMMPSTSTYVPLPVKPRTTLDEWMGRHLMLMKGRKLHYTTSSLEDSFDDVKDLYAQPTEMKNFSECIFQLWKIEPKLVAIYVNDNSHTVHLKAYEKAALFRNFFLAFQAIEEPYLTWHYGGLHKEWWVMPNKMFFSFEHINDYFAGNVMSGLNLDMPTAVRIFIPSFEQAMELVARPMADLGVTYIEMVALSGVIYLDPMTPGLTKETRDLLRTARGELIANILKYYQEEMFVHSRVPDTPEIRLAQLLDISAGIKIHAERTRENMQILSLFDVIPVDNLFNEMCNIVTAYNDETRSKLRARAIKEELVDMVKIQKSDIKWREYNRMIESGLLQKGSFINQMDGPKNGPTPFMAPPVFERDEKMEMKVQLALMQAAKKEEPDRMSESPSIPPAAVLAAAAVSLSPPSAPTAAAAAAVAVPTSHPALPLPHPMPFLPSLIPPQPSPAASAAAIHAAAHAARTNRTLANLVATSQPSITVAAPTMPTSHSDAMMQKIFDGRHKAEHMHALVRNNMTHHVNHPALSADHWIRYAGFVSDAESEAAAMKDQKKYIATQIAETNAIRHAQQQQLAGPSDAKRPRVADSGTNPVTPPSSNSELLAQLQQAMAANQSAALAVANQSAANAAAAAVAAAQNSGRVQVLMPYEMLMQQLQPNPQQLTTTPFIPTQQQMASAAAAAMAPVTLASQLQQLQQQQQLLQQLQQLQQQQQQQQQHPF
uniref:Nhr-66 n=1 Tax=Pristionchus pacificus TaxID=54126 RepID=A0A8R1YKC7_PRIPA